MPGEAHVADTVVAAAVVETDDVAAAAAVVDHVGRSKGRSPWAKATPWLSCPVDEYLANTQRAALGEVMQETNQMEKEKDGSGDRSVEWRCVGQVVIAQLIKLGRRVSCS